MKYKHALFLYPYIEKSIGMCLFPPTGLEYVATAAKGHIGKITIVDLRYEKILCDTGKLVDFIRKDIDIICVSITWNRQVDEVYGLMNLMPDKIPLVVGGYKATEDVDEIFKRCPKVDIRGTVRITAPRGWRLVSQNHGRPIEQFLCAYGASVAAHSAV